MSYEQDLSKKNVLVIGGGSGAGQATAWWFAREGARVAVSGRRMDRLEETLRGHPGDPPILARAADVSKRDEVNELVAWADKEMGSIDILVNSAGINVPRRMMGDLDPAEWDEIFAVNATGAFNCTHAVLPGMRKQKDGLIIHINSTSGKRAGRLGGVAYSASKHAMASLATSVALEEAPHGIRVTTIFPGEINTPILEGRPVPVSEEHKARILQADDVAYAVVMIAKMPPKVHVCELLIKPITQEYI